MASDTSIQHSPLPWKVVSDEFEGEHWLWLEDKDSHGICGFQDPDHGVGDVERANAAHIVRAVNAYPQLTAVLRDWYHMFRPVLQPGTEGEALLERTADALGIDLKTGRPL